jgi:Protein of unknown function (DUF3574)
MRCAAIAAALMVLAITPAPAARAQPAERTVQPRVDAHAADTHGRLRCPGLADAEAFARSELFFGLSRPGGVVTEQDFKGFVDAYVTPRFPEGLTLISGVGQFRDASGTTIVEGSKLLILLYPRRDRDADGKIEQIRSDYKRAFQQQSVLRSDDASCVSF